MGFHSRLVLIRQYEGSKNAFGVAHKMGNAGSIRNSERSRLKSLKHLAKWADRLGVRLDLNIRLPE